MPTCSFNKKSLMYYFLRFFCFSLQCFNHIPLVVFYFTFVIGKLVFFKIKWSVLLILTFSCFFMTGFIVCAHDFILAFSCFSHQSKSFLNDFQKVR